MGLETLIDQSNYHQESNFFFSLDFFGTSLKKIIIKTENFLPKHVLLTFLLTFNNTSIQCEQKTFDIDI